MHYNETFSDKRCKYIKREGESCTLNNNCTYPNCKIETFNTKRNENTNARNVGMG